jgi:hypothetical protein
MRGGVYGKGVSEMTVSPRILVTLVMLIIVAADQHLFKPDLRLMRSRPLVPPRRKRRVHTDKDIPINSPNP